MPPPIALQLYTLREELGPVEGNRLAVQSQLDYIAHCGYVGVETAGIPAGLTAAELAQMCAAAGLTICSAHVPLPGSDDVNAVLDEAEALGVSRIASGYLPPQQYATLDGIHEAADLFNAAHAAAAERGLAFGVHNHWWEFETHNGRSPYHILRERLHPDIFFEIDVYWVQTAGVDPAKIIAECGARAPLLHIKDGPATQKADMTAVGAGNVDIPAVINAGAGHTEWLIVELDRHDGDMRTAVRHSIDYLTREGLGRGR